MCLNKLTGKGFAVLLFTLFMLAGFTFQGLAAEYTLTIMGTNDLHQYILPYDYMNDEPFDRYGFSKTYTLIEEVRANREHTLLIDAGDTIQGSMVGNYEAMVEPLAEGETQAIIKAMNAAGYDAAAIGNHEVQDFGLWFLDRAIEGSDFPWLTANMMMADDPTQFYTKPYTIIEKELDGKPLDIGVIGFLPPQIMQWGRTHLYGEVVAKDIIPQAMRILPELAQKTDIIIVSGHTGLSDAPLGSSRAREHAGYYLAQLEEVDAMIGGHSHAIFPSSRYEGMDGVDLEQGTVFGVPTSMAGRWGEALGVIDLHLNYDDGWEVTGHDVNVKRVDEDTPSHPLIEEIAQEIHEKTIEYVRTPIGSTEICITGYFSQIKDSALLTVINEAQMWYAEKNLADTEYEDLPILSVAAPFRTSAAVSDDITIGDVTDIYVYDNIIYILKFNGDEIKDFLERSAEHFAQIDPESTEPQRIETVGPSFNYDVIEGIEYEIDITKPTGDRIVNLTFEGEPVTSDHTFAVVTNDYRAGGGGDFPHTGDDAEVIFSSPDVNRDQIIFFIEEKGVINPQPSGNWRIKPVETKAPLLFRAHSNAIEYLERYRDTITGIEVYDADEGLFEIHLEELGRN